ncbi:hypothetical protein AQUCO_00200935v1 [Aquilegia coerulea]|uniref:Uncharacterized protein n=1 Tax=Aquilegia coerulea TaxID=218851 RepID=A0A2G5F5G3_AQUCA|nr:hypothetical protein AQUCO_00200935v1 [Aquilegia coerulea]
MNKRDIYEPQPWDVIALSDAIPSCIDDLNKPPRYYFPALVVGVGDVDNPNMFEIFTTKPIFVQKRQETKRETLFATFLINITTNIRIWRALHAEEHLNLIKVVLMVDSKAGEKFDICPSQEIQALMGYPDFDLNSLNLNESQLNAVLSSVETSRCNHKNSVSLIWGPPGTGKTKTIVTMLSVLLRMKCRTLTCAPTNIVVVQLFIIFLDYRVDRLAECFAPLTGWRHQLNTMTSLLEDPTSLYHLYLENAKIENEEKKDGHEDGNENEVNQSIQSEEEEEDETSAKVLTFSEFLRKQFGCIAKEMKYCIQNLCTHLPTSFISATIVSKMNRLLYLLKSLKVSSYGDTFANEELEKLFDNSEDVENTTSQTSASCLANCAKECLKVLKFIRGEFSVPDFFEKSLIRTFCLEKACLIFCSASSSANLHDAPPFELLVIDEPAQLKECESAIPLQLPQIRHAILIGDELQLPAMIKSKVIVLFLF